MAGRNEKFNKSAWESKRKELCESLALTANIEEFLGLLEGIKATILRKVNI